MFVGGLASGWDPNGNDDVDDIGNGLYDVDCCGNGVLSLIQGHGERQDREGADGEAYG